MTIDELSEADVEQIWLEESERQLIEVTSGSVETVSAEDALARARARSRDGMAPRSGTAL